VTEGGWHAAEGLIVARYFMFTQVYFHKTRVIYDHHLQGALADLLQGGIFPDPKGNHLKKYLQWDDWRVLGLLQKRKGGDHGQRLAGRKHFREVIHTSETPSAGDLDRLAKWREALGDLLAAEMPAEKSWYKAGPADIQILVDTPKLEVEPLSKCSSVVRNMEPIRQVRLYSRPEQRAEAADRIANI
jgi:HD superfamily phosphohydrolase